MKKTKHNPFEDGDDARFVPVKKHHKVASAHVKTVAPKKHASKKRHAKKVFVK